MKTKLNSNLLQSGQAILVVALVMVGLIGALGLAVDGGGLAFLYRDAQNAADSAALAAAYARCTGGDLQAAALTAADDNGFDNSGSSNWVTVQSPVASVPSGSQDMDTNNYVSVSVRATKQAYFIQILYPQGLEATASAVAHCTPATGSGVGFAMFGIGATSGTSSSCHSGCQPIEGNNLSIDGSVHSNDVVDWASNVSFVSGSATSNSYRPDPWAHLNTSQFAPGGSVWNSVPSNLRFNMTAADFNALNWSSLHGLYYISSGNVDKSIGTNRTLQPFTVVSNGTIRITNFNRGLTAFVDDVLAFSNYQFSNPNLCDTNTAIYINGSGDSRGIVYSPRGQQEVLYSGGTWVGSLVGKYVDWWGSGSAISTLRALPSQAPPMVGLSS